MEDGQRKRKRRTKPSASPDDSGDDNAKKRGRPRVDKQDESAADRRRTQIRMAQRAYRQRKESTLEDLRKRVSSLSSTLEVMNKAFMDCRNALAESGLSDGQMAQLRQTSLRFQDLMTSARNPDEEDSMSASPSSAPRELHHEQNMSPPGTVAVRNSLAWLDHSTLVGPQKRYTDSEIGMGYTMFLPENEQGTSHPSYGNMFNVNIDLPGMSPDPSRPMNQPEHIFRAGMRSPSDVPLNLPPPATYSFQESSFGRRLHRAGLEAGYYLLNGKARRPKTFERVFKLSLIGQDENKLRASLKAVLDKGPHESLDAFGMGLIHVGGAGTHYPRKDQYGNVHVRQKSYDLGVVGPQTLALLETAARQNKNTDMTVQIVGYEGVWFDPYDVEGYLEEKGIVIDPMSSFAEAVVDESVISDHGSTTGSSHNPSTPPDMFAPGSTFAPFSDEQLMEIQRYERNAPKPPDFSELAQFPFPDVGFSDAQTGSWVNFTDLSRPSKHARSSIPPLGQPWEGAQPNELMQDALVDALNHPDSYGGVAAGHGHNATMTMHRHSTRRKRIIIDVGKFVKVLTLSGICLGSSPGFKRNDVDRALAIASFEV